MNEKTAILDTRWIQQRRLAMGLSARALAHRVGTTHVTIKRMEEGMNDPDFSLAMLQRLAEALEIPLPMLFPETRTATDAEEESSDASVDGQRLAAALRARDSSVRLDVLAGAFGWSHARTVDGLTSLRNSLVGTGLELHSVHGRYVIRPTGVGLSKDDRARLGQTELDFEGITISEARVLRTVIGGGIGSEWEQNAGTGDRNVLYRLLNKNLVHREDERFVINPDVAYSLGLAELSSN